MSSEHIPEISDDEALHLGEVDLAIEDVLRSLDECIEDLGIEAVDRALIINHVRWAYIEGWTQRHQLTEE